MITITTTTTNQNDVQALRDFLGGQRRGLTLYVPDIITGEQLRIPLADLDGYEAWIIEGDPGVTTSVDRQRHLLDDATEEPIGPRDTLYSVLWVDSDGDEHQNRLTGRSVDGLRNQVGQDEFGNSEVLRVDTYAEPTRLIPVLWQIARR